MASGGTDDDDDGDDDDADDPDGIKMGCGVGMAPRGGSGPRLV
jgi:hypothetical protein